LIVVTAPVEGAVDFMVTKEAEEISPAPPDISSGLGIVSKFYKLSLGIFFDGLSNNLKVFWFTVVKVVAVRDDDLVGEFFNT